MSNLGDSIQPELVALSFGSNKAYVDLAWEALGGFQASYPQARCIVKDPILPFLRNLCICRIQ
jgi:hypothetical protein